MNAIMKVRFLCSVLLWASICLSAMGQMEDLPQGHPRYLTNADSKQETLQLIKEEAWAQDVFERLEQRTSRYADLGEDWHIEVRDDTGLILFRMDFVVAETAATGRKAAASHPG